MSSCKKNAQAPKCVNCDNIAIAIDAINSVMRRKGLGLGDMYHAINKMIEKVVNETIIRLRAEGKSIREIARFVHMDDSRVSKIIKTANRIACGLNACKPNKPCKPCKPCRPKNF